MKFRKITEELATKDEAHVQPREPDPVLLGLIGIIGCRIAERITTRIILENVISRNIFFALRYDGLHLG